MQIVCTLQELLCRVIGRFRAWTELAACKTLAIYKIEAAAPYQAPHQLTEASAVSPALL